MRIGELSRRARVSVRMLRHYEQKGLLQPSRRPNGYRDYAEDDVARAQQISSLVRSGLPTRLITVLLDAPPPAGGSGGSRPALEDALAAELARLDARIGCMTLSRDTIRRHLDLHRGA